MEKPTMKQRAEAFATFIWDSEQGKVLGRGGRSWAEIGLFYLVYYACLASFFAATIAVFYETIDVDKPKLLSDSSLLDGNPGMGFRPMPDLDKKMVSAKAGGDNKAFVNNLVEFLKPYEKADLENTVCAGIDEPREKEDVACKFDMAKFTETCNSANGFGFNDGKPCVLVKLNKVYGWVPEMWDDAADSGLPDDVQVVYNKNFVPIRCYTKDKGDMDLLGEVDYYPQQGFPVHFFPYKKQKDYRAPLVFVQFNSTTHGKKLEVECRAYAKNIKFDRTDIQGSTQFELKVSS